MSQFYREDPSGPNFDDLLAATQPAQLLFPAPAAGAEFSIAVPAGNYWAPVTIVSQFSTSGTVSTRTPQFLITYSGATMYSAGCINQLGAGNAGTFQLGLGLGYSAALAGGSQQQIGIPLLILPPGAVIASSTANIQAGDQWGSQSLYVRRVLVSGIGTGPVSTVAEPPLTPTPITV